MPSEQMVTILVVEDDPGHARLIERNLRYSNIANAIVILSDGQQALDFLFGQGEFEGKEYHASSLLVLLDLNLPVLDGFQVLQAMKSDDRTMESILLDAEKPIQKIASEFDINAQFHKGFDPPVQAIVEKIRDLKRMVASQEQDLADKQEQIAALTQQVTQMESQLGDLKSREASLTELMEQQQLRKEKFDRVEKTFSPGEALILREGDKVIIQLYGLTFPVGKAIIESQYFGLLAKVIKAIDEYPEYDISIEGHTDSRGGDATNLKLSTERANAVQEYLIASAELDASRIKAIGYGESNPIASNETEEGRRKNRRITVVIHPQE